MRMIRKGKLLLVGLTVLTVGIAACVSSDKEETENVSESSVSESSVSVAPLVASSVAPEETASSSEEQGPDPENVVDVHITRGSYVLPKFTDEQGFIQVTGETYKSQELYQILTEMRGTSVVAGVLREGDTFTVLSRENDGWLYVESGKVRGFMPRPNWIPESASEGSEGEEYAGGYYDENGNYIEEAGGYYDENGNYIEEAGGYYDENGNYIEVTGGYYDENGEYVETAPSADMPEISYAEAALDYHENPAYLYKKITSLPVPAEKAYAICRKKELEIREDRSDEARVVGTLMMNGTAFVLEDCGDGWVFVESGSVRGFVRTDFLMTGKRAEIYMERSGDVWAERYAAAVIPFEENQAAYYTCSFVNPDRTAAVKAREYLQILGRDRTNELEIPEELNGLKIGWVFTCTPDYGSIDWMYSCLDVLRIWQRYGAVYSENVAMIDDCYLVACTATFGEIGDYVTFYFEDGTPLHCIIADEKSSNDRTYSSYGHIHDNEIDVIEAETSLKINPGRKGCVPWWGGHRISSCVNHGHFQPYWGEEELS